MWYQPARPYPCSLALGRANFGLLYPCGGTHLYSYYVCFYPKWLGCILIPNLRLVQKPQDGELRRRHLVVTMSKSFLSYLAQLILLGSHIGWFLDFFMSPSHFSASCFACMYSDFYRLHNHILLCTLMSVSRSTMYPNCCSCYGATCHRRRWHFVWVRVRVRLCVRMCVHMCACVCVCMRVCFATILSTYASSFRLYI